MPFTHTPKYWRNPRTFWIINRDQISRLFALQWRLLLQACRKLTSSHTSESSLCLRFVLIYPNSPTGIYIWNIEAPKFFTTQPAAHHLINRLLINILLGKSCLWIASTEINYQALHSMCNLSNLIVILLIISSFGEAFLSKVSVFVSIMISSVILSRQIILKLPQLARSFRSLQKNKKPL